MYGDVEENASFVWTVLEISYHVAYWMQHRKEVTNKGKYSSVNVEKDEDYIIFVTE